jgi:hypothetical protein
MNTEAANKNSSPVEESARRESLDLIFCGIHTFKFIDRLNQDGKDLTSSFPANGVETGASSESGAQSAVGDPEEASSMKERRVKDRLGAQLASSCDKYGHSLGDASERFSRRWRRQTNAPLADRFGHVCPSEELASTGDKEKREIDQIHRFLMMRAPVKRR